MVVVGGGSDGWEKKRLREIAFTLVLCRNELSLQVHAPSLQVNFHKVKKVTVGGLFFASCTFRFVYKSQGRNVTEVQSFIPSLYLSRRE